MSGSNTSASDPSDFSEFLGSAKSTPAAKTAGAVASAPVAAPTPASNDPTDFSDFLSPKSTGGDTAKKPSNRLMYDSDGTYLGRMNDDGTVTKGDDPSVTNHASTLGNAVSGAAQGIPLVGQLTGALADRYIPGHVDRGSAAYVGAEGASNAAGTVGLTALALPEGAVEGAASLAGKVAGYLPKGTKWAAQAIPAITDTSGRVAAGAAAGGAAANVMTDSKYASTNPYVRAGEGLAAGVVGASVPGIAESVARGVGHSVAGTLDAFGKGPKMDVDLDGTTPNLEGVAALDPRTVNMRTSDVNKVAAKVKDFLPDAEQEYFRAPYSGANQQPLAGEHVTTGQQYAGATGAPSAALQKMQEDMASTAPELHNSIAQQNAQAQADALQSVPDNAHAEFSQNFPNRVSGDAIGASQQAKINASEQAGQAATMPLRAQQQTLTDQLPGQMTAHDLGINMRNAVEGQQAQRMQQARDLYNQAWENPDDRLIPMSNAQAVANRIISPPNAADGDWQSSVGSGTRSILRRVVGTNQNQSMDRVQAMLHDLSAYRQQISTPFGMANPSIARKDDVGHVTNVINSIYDAIDGKTNQAIDAAHAIRAAQVGETAAGPAAGLGEGAGANIADARKNYAQTIAAFNRGVGGRITNQTVEPSTLGAYAYGAGKAAQSRFEDLRSILPDEVNNHLATEQTFQDLRKAGAIDNDGQLDMSKFANPTSTGTRILNRFPSLGLTNNGTPLKQSMDLQNQINGLALHHARQTQELREQLAGKFIGMDPDVALRRAVGGGRIGLQHKANLNTLIDQVQHNPEATAGLKSTVADWLISSMRNADGKVDRRSINNVLATMRSGNGPNPLVRLFNGQGVANIDRVSASLARASRTEKGTGNLFQRRQLNPVNWKENKTVVQHGEGTANSLIAYDVLKSMFHGGSEHGGGHAAAHGAAHAGLVHSLGGLGFLAAKKVASALNEHLVQRLKSKAATEGVQNQHDLLQAAVMSPRVMSMLMQHVPNNHVSPMLFRRYISSLGQLSADRMVNKPAKKDRNNGS